MDDPILKEFLVESSENLDRFDEALVRLEQSPGDRELLDSIFRTIHTIKGTCGFFGFSRLEAVTHAGENLLAALRDGQLAPDRESTDALLALGDCVRQRLAGIETTGEEGAEDASLLIERLSRIAGDESADAAASPGDASATPSSPSPPAWTPAPGAPTPAFGGNPGCSDRFAPVRGRLGDALVQRGYLLPEDLSLALEMQARGDRRRLGEILITMGVVGLDQVFEAMQRLQEPREPRVAESTIRVDVGVLDHLMNLVDELVIAQSQVLQSAAGGDHSAFLGPAQHLARVAAELQGSVMQTRVQPIAAICGKLPRLVRDLAQSCGKAVRFELDGKSTALDQTVIQAIKDPLTHAVRNAVDHGIETPELRLAAGKPPQGRVSVRACHEGGQARIEVADDGAGVDPERIKEKALQRSLITPEQAARLSEAELVNLLFLPGFSTAESVTHVSGRGVGLDVVKSSIEALGGEVDLRSERGKGSLLTLRVPLTLSVMQALLVCSGGERYAIPDTSVLELLPIETGARSGDKVGELGEVEPRDQSSLSLLNLKRVLAAEEPAEPSELGPNKDRQDSRLGSFRSRASCSSYAPLLGPSSETGKGSVVVVRAGERRFGLVVDQVEEVRSIVGKPLCKPLRSLPLFGGATILEAGEVVLILDVAGLARQAGIAA